jgi:phospholipase C
VCDQIIIFMQENRAFDHYYGMLNGVRGFNDRASIPIHGQPSAFYQPVKSNATYMLPFRVDMHRSSAVCMDAPCMSYQCDVGMWNEGRYDSWNTARDHGTV